MINGGGLDFDDEAVLGEIPFGRASRFGARGAGALISFTLGGCVVNRRDRSRRGETRAETFDDDAAGNANGCEYGDGIA